MSRAKRSSLCGWRGPILAAALAVGAPSGLYAQEGACPSPAPDLSGERGRGLRLVVAVDAETAGIFRTQGAGVILGWSEGPDPTILIVTARHVVFQGAEAPTPRRARVRFAQDCTNPVPAEVCSSAVELDVALLCVDMREVPGDFPPELDRLGRLSIDAEVYPVGCPNGLSRCWSVGPPDYVSRESEGDIRFNSFQVAAGNSGGPLFNDRWEVVGLVWFRGDGWASAIPIELARETVCAQAIPGRGSCQGVPTLRRASVPRAPYRWSVGAAWVSGGSLPADRSPSSLRVQLAYQLSDHLEIHGGFMRLQPDNLTVDAGLLGVGSVWKTGRLLLNPFVEGAYARLEGLYDSGGFLAGGGYQPVLTSFAGRGPGLGVGLSAQVQLIRHVNLEALLGHWRFLLPSELPENTGDMDLSPKFDGLVWSIGLRTGW